MIKLQVLFVPTADLKILLKLIFRQGLSRSTTKIAKCVPDQIVSLLPLMGIIMLSIFRQKLNFEKILLYLYKDAHKELEGGTKILREK